MQKLTDIVSGWAKSVWHEYTRIDNRSCNGCGREVFGGDGFGEQWFCTDCYKHLPLIGENYCERCGRSTVIPVKRCFTCDYSEDFFDRARSVFVYAPPVSGMIRAYKYDCRKYLAEIFVSYMGRLYYKEFPDTEMVTFIPGKRIDRIVRGFSHGEYLAEKFAATVGVECVDTMVKSKRLSHQARLGRNKRLENLKHAFKVRNRALVKGKNVLVVDDVITTGATAEYVAKALKDAGAKTVNVITIASAVDYRTARALGYKTGGLGVTLRLPLQKDKDKGRSE